MKTTYTETILATLKSSVNRRKNKNFTGYELHNKTGESTYWGMTYSSTMRALRRLKEQGKINYTCTSAWRSEYTLNSINV